MAKRKRNIVGHFISSFKGSFGSNSEGSNNFIKNNISSLFMIALIIFMVSPWITLLIKSKKFQAFIFSLLKFYREHFISDEEFNNGKCGKTEDI